MAQHPMKVVLLDLDGTLTKSDGGIIASVVKTFEELGRSVPDDAGRSPSTAATMRIAPCSMIRTSPATKFPAAW